MEDEGREAGGPSRIQIYFPLILQPVKWFLLVGAIQDTGCRKAQEWLKGV